MRTIQTRVVQTPYPNNMTAWIQNWLNGQQSLLKLVGIEVERDEKSQPSFSITSLRQWAVSEIWTKGTAITIAPIPLQLEIQREVLPLPSRKPKPSRNKFQAFSKPFQKDKTPELGAIDNILAWDSYLCDTTWTQSLIKFCNISQTNLPRKVVLHNETSLKPRPPPFISLVTVS